MTFWHDRNASGLTYFIRIFQTVIAYSEFKITLEKTKVIVMNKRFSNETEAPGAFRNMNLSSYQWINKDFKKEQKKTGVLF
jgi:hypothetical protein